MHSSSFMIRCMYIWTYILLCYIYIYTSSPPCPNPSHAEWVPLMMGYVNLPQWSPNALFVATRGHEICHGSLCGRGDHLPYSKSSPHTRRPLKKQQWKTTFIVSQKVTIYRVLWNYYLHKFGKCKFLRVFLYSWLFYPKFARLEVILKVKNRFIVVIIWFVLFDNVMFTCGERWTHYFNQSAKSTSYTNFIYASR